MFRSNNILNFKSRNTQFSGYQEIEPFIANVYAPEDNDYYPLPSDTARGIVSTFDVNKGDGYGIEQVSSTGTSYGKRALRLFTSNKTGYISLGKYTDNVNFIDVITITNDNKVGINNTNPYYTLDVKNGIVGALSFTGEYANIKHVTVDDFSVNNVNTINLSAVSITGTNLNISGTGFINNLSANTFNITNFEFDYLTVHKLASINSITGTNSNFTNTTVEGNLIVNGEAFKLSSQLWKIASDKRVKTNIKELNISECLDSINQIKLKEFQYIPGTVNSPLNKKFKGVIADELQQTHPNSVHEVEKVEFNTKTFNNFKTVDLSEQIYDLIGSVQCLNNEILELKSKLNNK